MNKTTNKLTETEKTVLRSTGHSFSDVREISNSIKNTKYYIIIQETGKQKEIDEEKAIRTLGREEWLRGISRSTFYNETTRWGINGERIKMVTKNWSR